MALETDLLLALFAASTAEETGTEEGRPSWPWFLDQLCHRHHADSARLQIIVQGRISNTWHTGGGQTGPDLTVLQQMRNDRVYSQVDMPGGHIAQDAVRALKVMTRLQGFAVLTMRRQSPDFRAADTAQLSRLGPYLGQAVATWFTLARNRARSVLEQSFNQGRGTHWLHFAPSGKVIELSSGLPSALAESAAFRLLPNGRLHFTDPAQAAAFRRALTAAQEGGSDVMHLSRDPQLELVVVQRMLAGTPALIGILNQPPPARSIPVVRFAHHFRLNRSEARLTQLLCDGFSLQEAAAELGWTIETTRSCSKQIFARMGVKGQTGVIRRVFGSEVWSAEPQNSETSVQSRD